MSDASIRYDTIDLARGIALLGVAMVNVHAYAVGWWSHYALDLASHWADVASEYAVATLFMHRAFPLLAFLFGVGLSLQWLRALQGGMSEHDARTDLRCRYLALLLLGLTHAVLLWPGDITSVYALIALLLLIRWPWSSRALWCAVVVVTTIAVAMYGSLLLIEADVLAAADLDEAPPSFANPVFASAWAEHVDEYCNWGIAQGLVPEVWIALLLGVAIAQSGRFERWLSGAPTSRPLLYAAVMMLTMGTLLEWHGASKGAWRYGEAQQYSHSGMLLGAPLAMFGSVVVMLVFMRSWRASLLPSLRGLVLAAGKTPLTQFFGQSLVFVLIFNKSLIGWHGELGRAGYSAVAALTVVLWAGFAQAWLASRVGLGKTARGPAELMWMALARWLRKTIFD